jgi:hypothetical protein
MKRLLLVALLLTACITPTPTRPLRLGMTWAEAKEANGGRLVLHHSYSSAEYSVRVARVVSTYYTFERSDEPGRHFVLVSKYLR